MALGICLVIIFLLWMIERHNRWGTLGRAFGIISIIGVLAMLGLLFYVWHEDHVRARESQYNKATTRDPWAIAKQEPLLHATWNGEEFVCPPETKVWKSDSDAYCIGTTVRAVWSGEKLVCPDGLKGWAANLTALQNHDAYCVKPRQPDP